MLDDDESTAVTPAEGGASTSKAGSKDTIWRLMLSNVDGGVVLLSKWCWTGLEDRAEAVESWRARHIY